MACYRPLDAYRSRIKGKTGKSLITFDRRDSIGELKLPCGRCIGCRLERSRQWALRCTHEASLFENNCFITLTYDQGHVPRSGSLEKKHFQDFMKRLRWHHRGIEPVDVEGKETFPIRYYMCGEYGEKFSRPHYHACIFNFDFPDKVFFKENNGFRLYKSVIADDIWGFGFVGIGDLTFESAAYCARYIVKKVNGDRAAEHYSRLDVETGEVNDVIPEFTTMSRRPGIGARWLSRFHGDVYPDDFVVLRGRRMMPPKFYDYLLELDDPMELERLKIARVKAGYKRKEDSTPERLVVREACKKAQIGFLKRSYDNDS